PVVADFGGPLHEDEVVARPAKSISCQRLRQHLPTLTQAVWRHGGTLAASERYDALREGTEWLWPTSSVSKARTSTRTKVTRSAQSWLSMPTPVTYAAITAGSRGAMPKSLRRGSSFRSSWTANSASS